MKIPPMKFIRHGLCFTNHASFENRRNPGTRLFAVGRITQIVMISASYFLRKNDT